MKRAKNQFVERLESRRMLADTLVMYTYGGDANPEGNGLAWAHGDFNYDGKVDVNDYPGATPIAIAGTSKSDRILIYDGMLGIDVSVNGEVTHYGIHALNIDAGRGDDVVSIELANSLPTDAITIR